MTALQWRDVDGIPWQIVLDATHISLQSPERELTIQAGSWNTDVYVAEHREQFIVRFDTFACTVRFMLAQDKAAPLLALLSRPPKVRDTVAPDEPHRPHAPLLWPKVSPLAVWALACASLAFVPYLGAVPAAASVVLLTLHRSRAPRAAAWAHSRRLCQVTVIILAAGIAVSVLAAWCWSRPVPNVAPPAAEVQPPGTDGPTWGIVAGGLFVVLLSLTVHEAAHAISAWWLGDDLARSLGRVTLNPLAHIDPFGTVILPALLVWAHAPVFGYAKPVPVRVESLPRHRRAHILISLAGPGSNLVLAALSLMLLLGIGSALRICVPDAAVAHFSDLSFTSPVQITGFPLAAGVAALVTILKLSFIINAALAVFNLIPIPPLDGSWVLQHLFPRTLGVFYATVRPYGFLVFLAAIYGGLFNYLVVPIAAVLVPGFLLLDMVTGWH